MRFQDAARDGRAIVYAGIQADPLVDHAARLLAAAGLGQRVLARAVMNGDSTDARAWREMFPGLFARSPAASEDETAETERSESILAAALEVAGKGDQARSQYRGAIVEATTSRILARRVPAAAIHQERRILFDGVRAEIHPYDVTVELPDRAEAYDCKWGARGINPDVLLQLEAARGHAASEGARLLVCLVIFDARLSCRVRLARQTAALAGIRLVTLETLDALGRTKAAPTGTPP
jgi:hypothetical protein